MSFNDREANVTVDGKILFAKVHGLSADVNSGATHTFVFDVPYTDALYSGTEIIYDVKSQTNLNVEVYDPNSQTYVPYEQYGFNVCAGDGYTREMPYAARVGTGVKLKCSVTNTTTTTRKMGINFILHEAREQ